MNIEKTITRQIAQCMAFHGDNPEELMIKLESLVMEWYIKGKTGFTITCPFCKGIGKIQHFEWSALTCLHCKTDINLKNWHI